MGTCVFLSLQIYVVWHTWLSICQAAYCLVAIHYGVFVGYMFIVDDSFNLLNGVRVRLRACKTGFKYPPPPQDFYISDPSRRYFCCGF